MRLAFIGSFGHWPCVADELSANSSVSFAGVASAFEGEEVLSMLTHYSMDGGTPVFDTVDSILAETQPDVAVISTRPDHIAEAAIKAANAGCDLICEKPLGLSHHELREVRDAVTRNGVRLLPMLSMRTDPVFNKARELYRSGEIGEVSLVNSRKSYGFGDRPEWYGMRAAYGGTWPWIGIHAVDMIHFITGLTFASVTARHSNRHHAEWPDCEDTCAGMFELSNGAFATASIDLMRPSGAPTHGDDWIRIVGTKGVLEARANTSKILLTGSHGESVVEVPSKEPIPFYESILNTDSENELVGAEDGFILTDAVLCARESADNGGREVQISHA